jgi:hypothetical protein
MRQTCTICDGVFHAPLATSVCSSVCANEKRRRDRAPGLEEGDDGWMIGRDPRRMSQDDLRALGHEPMSPLRALRLRCLDCCCGSIDEVRKCVSVTCASWPFRMGENPWRTVSEAKREAGRRLAANRFGGRSDLPASAGTPSPVPDTTPELDVAV